MSLERLQELAALNAASALEGADLEEFQALLGQAGHDAKAELASFNNIAALLAASTPSRQPRSELKARILTAIENKKQQAARPSPGFRKVPSNDETGWRNLLVPGASVKVLSIDETRGYAIVLGRLEAGASYPPHTHSGTEDLYLLSGDLHLGEHTLKAGDFHHSDAGTSHGVNYSVEGCVLLGVVPLSDLRAQMAGAAQTA